jgi:DNA-binding NtrC family response regulator
MDTSLRPIYAVDSERRLVYCNPALAKWLGLDPGRIVGRNVEYHSQPATEGGTKTAADAPLTDLCPPPQALAGEPLRGTVGCVSRDGRLVHRGAEFVPIPSDQAAGGGVLVLLAEADLSAQELATELSEEPTGDELHRVIRSFRRGQATEHALESLLGDSPDVRKVRSQVAAAALSWANVIICGRPGSGREHVARAIHYQAKEATGQLVPVECGLATEDSLKRACESLLGVRDPKHRNTLLLLNLERLAPPLQVQILPLLTGDKLAARTVATLARSADEVESDQPQTGVSSKLLSALSTIRIDLPSLAERLDDLPILAQYFLEAANRGNQKQLGSLRPEVLDRLALYRWPGGLDELREVIGAAHAAAATHEITLSDLPAVVHHAAKAAALPRRDAEKIVLDELLESIEREVIERALAQAGGNKSAAADLLGMTRPRLYRRLVQLGLAGDDKAAEEGGPS